MNPAETVDATLRESGLEYERPARQQFVVNLPGTRRLKTACWLSVGEHAMSVEAFVMRKPDENAEQVYRYLLEHNTRMYAVAWSVDDSGDVYLSGKLPLVAVTPEEIDRVLGAVLEYADGSFNALLQLGFGSSIRREWAWRVKNNESLAKHAAFETFAAGE